MPPGTICRASRRGRWRSGAITTHSGELDFGIGTYFVPEGTGLVIERANDVKVRVAVDTDGTAVIKEVLVDGRPFDPSEQPGR